MEPPLSTGSGRSLLSRLRQLPEPVQLLYVIMFSVSMIPKDSLYIDKVCQVGIRIKMMMMMVIKMTRTMMIMNIQQLTKILRMILMNSPLILISL